MEGILGATWVASSASIQGGGSGAGGRLSGGWDLQSLADGTVSKGGRASAAFWG